MIVLGLNFGHDAGACVVADGRLLSVIQRERLSRVKHAATLDMATIEAALKAAGVSLDDIDYCAVSSTQHVELITLDPERLSIRYEHHDRHRAPCLLHDAVRGNGISPVETGSPLLDTVYRTPDPESYFLSHYFPEAKTRPESAFAWAPYIDRFATCELWNNGGARNLEWLRRFPADQVLKLKLRHAFHYPLVVELDGRKIPGYFVYHHLAHAASAYYPLGLDRAAVLCHDGGVDRGSYYNSGMIFLGEANRLHPIAPPNLALGRIYEGVAQHFEFGMASAPGKLMGLTSYGEPRFFDHRFIGNRVDWEARGMRFFARDWIKHCLDRARRMGYETAEFGKKDRITSPINADIAASTQKIFEETLLATADAVYDMMSEAGIGADTLCYAGGVALNCPANTRVIRESRFRSLHIPPWCDDGGLAIGAALAVYHNVLDQPLPDHRPLEYCAYLGRQTDATESEAAMSGYQDSLRWSRPDDPARAAAELIARNRVIGWMEGRSEIGPRALGHRSIFANPTFADNWPRVNRIKGREQWRPFAPVVLESDAADWFYGGPASSPHMLFTSTVKGDRLPAITHVDGSSRAQTVRKEDGEFHDILVHLKEITRVPVMMNTSFNGPGEPIVDRPDDALRCFLKSGLDAVFINGIMVEKRAA